MSAENISSEWNLCRLLSRRRPTCAIDPTSGQPPGRPINQLSAGLVRWPNNRQRQVALPAAGDRRLATTPTEGDHVGQRAGRKCFEAAVQLGARFFSPERPLKQVAGPSAQWGGKTGTEFDT